jgi:hypothetical protein
MTDAPERDVVELLQEAAQSIRVDGTPAQVGLSADEHEDIAREITRLRSQGSGVPAGWKLVPVEPTPEMLDAGINAAPIALDDDLESAYLAMLSASPQPPVGADGWREISTAKTGVAVILAAEGISGVWAIGEATLEDDDDQRDPSWWWASAPRGEYYSDDVVNMGAMPKYWMPLPAPPGVSPPVSAALQSRGAP